VCNAYNVLAINKQARIEIDAKRAGVGYTSEDALPRGREFKRLDSTYYIGWMLEGTYKNEHACDYLGYKNASIQLEKAVYLLEKDFSKELKKRTDNVMEYIASSKYQRDYDYTARCLYECYSNMEDGNKVWNLLQRVKKIDLQIEEYIESYNLMAWTVHRNRFYTSSKYPFLKNNIIENEKYANELLEQGNRKIKIDAALNKKIFTVDYIKIKEPSVWHYKSMLYAYQLNIQSGEYYYNKLRETPFFPSNNYGTFCAIQCNFKDAENYYGISKKQDYSDKRMKESYYYSTIIDVYKGEPKIAVQEMNDLIKAMGSTPGFGWYNLGLARSLLYDGQTELAKKYLQRAEDFKEIHIGTTLGQSHYDFTTALLKLVAKNKEIDGALFFNKNWWCSPTSIYKLSLLYAEKKALQFLIINQFAQNPERDKVIYKLFSTESTVSFDEIYQLIEGFSSNYFLERFKKELSTDTRGNVKRYYKYFIAKLLQKQKKYTEAISYLESTQRDMMIDTKYEKLFIARTYEAFAQCYKELDKNIEMQTAILNEFATYPQLVPYSNIEFPIQLKINATTIDEKACKKLLEKSKLNITNSKTNTIPQVQISFSKKGANKIMHYSTTLNGKEIYPASFFAYTSIEEATNKVLFYIFNIGNGDEIVKTKK
jgi:hypothetical protein